MTTRARLGGLAIAALLVLGAAACGDDDTDEATADDTTEAADTDAPDDTDGSDDTEADDTEPDDTQPVEGVDTSFGELADVRDVFDVEVFPFEGETIHMAASDDAVWLTAFYDHLVRIDVGSGEVVELDQPSIDVAVSGDRVWVADPDGDAVLLLDPDTGDVVESTELASNGGVAASSEAGWATDFDGVSQIVDGAIVATIPFQNNGVVEATDDHVWALNPPDNTLLGIDAATGEPGEPVALDTDLPAGDWVLAELAPTDDFVWVVGVDLAHDVTGAIVQVDAVTGEIVDAMVTELELDAVAATDDAVWAIGLLGPDDEYLHVLVRVDVADGDLTLYATPAFRAEALVVVGDDVWLGMDGQAARIRT